MKTLNLLTVEEVAALLRIDEVTVRRWLRGGELSGLKVGRAWRVDERALQAFLEARSGQSGQPRAWFVATPEALDASTGLGASEEPGDARTDLEDYWKRTFA